MVNGFIKLPHNLLKDPVWIKLPSLTKAVFLEIVSRSCFKPQKFNDHGKTIDLDVGEVCITTRDMVYWFMEWPEFKKKKLETSRTILKRILAILEHLHFCTLKVPHIKTVIKVTYPDIYDIQQNESEPRSEPKVTQDWPTKEERKERKDQKEKINKKEKAEKIEVQPLVFLTQAQFDDLVSRVGPDLAERMLKKLSSSNVSKGRPYKNDYGPLMEEGWAYQEIMKDEYAKHKQNYNGSSKKQPENSPKPAYKGVTIRG